MATILSVIDTAYRATLEEQDDTSLWFTHACKNSGADVHILLTGNAVNYAVKTQNPKPLHLGTSSVSSPNKFHEDLESFTKTGSKVFFIKEDLIERGIGTDSLIGIEGIKRSNLASFIDDYDHIWHW